MMLIIGKNHIKNTMPSMNNPTMADEASEFMVKISFGYFLISFVW